MERTPRREAGALHVPQPDDDATGFSLGVRLVWFTRRPVDAFRNVRWTVAAAQVRPLIATLTPFDGARPMPPWRARFPSAGEGPARQGQRVVAECGYHPLWYDVAPAGAVEPAGSRN